MKEIIIDGCKCACESASVIEPMVATGFNLTKGLEIGLIVLVVILTIIGLIIGFNKMKKDEDDDFGNEGYY